MNPLVIRSRSFTAVCSWCAAGWLTLAAALAWAAPVPVDDSYLVEQDSGFMVFNVLANDEDAGNLTISGFTAPLNGTVVDPLDGTLTFMPDGGFSGMTTFNYTVVSLGLERSAGDASEDDRFGVSAGASGDTIVVGAPMNDFVDTSAGSAYVYQRDQGGADNWGQTKQLFASGAAGGDLFGASVAIEGDLIVVGGTSDDHAEPIADAGSAYVFERDEGGAGNWGQIIKLIATDHTTGDEFGFSVAVSGDIIVVGAPNNDGTGSAYVFQRDFDSADNWGERTKLVASDAAAGDVFGCAVSISGDTIAVGAHGHNHFGSDSGAAYIFQRDEGGTDNWGQVTEVLSTDLESGDEFGFSVSISSDLLAVGARLEKEAAANAGAAYLFERDEGGADNWGEIKKLTADDATPSALLGTSIAADTDTVVVGADFATSPPGITGAAYCFERDQGGAGNWGQARKIALPSLDVNDRLGGSVAIDFPVIAVGAPFRDGASPDIGTMYVLDGTSGSAAVAVTVAATVPGLKPSAVVVVVLLIISLFALRQKMLA